MTGIRAFSGLRYASRDFTGLLAPPFDIVTADEQARLIDRNSHNILAIDNPVAGGDAGGDQSTEYDKAASTFERWIAHDVLHRDSQPAIYAITHEFPAALPEVGRKTRTGFMALLPAKPWAEASVRPHETTFRGPKEDRLRLMRATGAQTSPIFAIWTANHAVDLLLDNVVSRPPSASGCFDGELGTEMLRLWMVTGEAEIETVKSALRDSNLYIADGHHRYETAVTFAQESGSSATINPSVFAYMCGAEDPGLSLLATHRLVKFERGAMPPDMEAVARRLGDRWSTRRLDSYESAATILQQNATDEPVFVVQSREESLLFTRESDANETAPAALPVQLLHAELMPAFGIDEKASVRFTRDPAQAITEVESGIADLAFLLTAPRVADVIRVADAGESMPQKSTYFYPKVPTGLVIYRP